MIPGIDHDVRTSPHSATVGIPMARPRAKSFGLLAAAINGNLRRRIQSGKPFLVREGLAFLTNWFFTEVLHGRTADQSHYAHVQRH
jgi:hypothetical protein